MSLPVLTLNYDTKIRIRMKRALATQKIIKSKRQSKSLKKLLTIAKYLLHPKKYGCSNCGICKNIMEGESNEFKFGEIFTIN